MRKSSKPGLPASAYKTNNASGIWFLKRYLIYLLIDSPAAQPLKSRPAVSIYSPI